MIGSLMNAKAFHQAQTTDIPLQNLVLAQCINTSSNLFNNKGV